MSVRISRYVDVAVPLPLRALLTYGVPAGAAGCSEPGARAIVPVGRRVVTGMISAHRAEPGVDTSRVKPVAELPDEAPIVPADLLALALWAARYYAAPPGAMMAALLPPGLARRSEILVKLAAGPHPDPRSSTVTARAELDSRLAATLAGIPPAGIPARRLGLSPALLKRLERDGRVTLEPILPAARVREKFARLVRLPAGIGMEEALARCGRAPRQRELLAAVAAGGPEGLAADELEGRLGRVDQTVRALRAKGLLAVGRREVRRAPQILQPAAPAGRRAPTHDQAAALQPVLQALGDRSGRAFLLMGVTGSGKTEVYLRAIERCVETGRSALYLVPEIALTPLLARDLRSRLGPGLAILHSSLSQGERFDEWRRVRSGQARIVLGARSAVLAPLQDLGLVVVDEEQDGSYKQEEDPRYNARDLGLVRARDSGAVAILGSATPSIESYHAARGISPSRRLELLRLPARVLHRPMARVRLVDMREEFAREGREEVVSAPIREAVRERLARGEQAILLLNRRGYAPFALCRSCGAREGCRRCSVALTYHRSEDRMCCHYCGYRRGRPKVCSTCGSAKVVLTGTGTERLEELMRASFPEARLARLDRDTARGRRRPAEILSAFERGDFNLLVGTQMVAKGHDFPGVTIVGVIGADAALAMPDFRAAERTFQLLTQVAGRAGRGDEPGEVLVQVYHADHYAIESAARQDYEAFYEKESRFRRMMKYPPFTVMANLIVQADGPEAGVSRARLAAEAVRAAAGDSIQVIGPAVAPLARLKGRYRYQILVKGASRRKLSDALNEAASALAPRGLTSSRDLLIDIDPVSLL